MIVSYYIERKSDKSILGYYCSLHEAKYRLIKYFKVYNDRLRIISLKGSYFGEGFYQYQITYNGIKFSKSKAENWDI